jgi:hypothetical protein
MKLHHNIKDFEALIKLKSQVFNVPLNALRKDYCIILVLKNLASSALANRKTL